MSAVHQVRVTPHFHRTLDDIKAFLREDGATQAYSALLDDLAETVISNLERFPEMGRDFCPLGGSVEAVRGMEELRAFEVSDQFREYILPPYLLLYATAAQTVFLLAIRHHSQLSFDFAGLWGDV